MVNNKMRTLTYTAILMALMIVMHFSFGYISTPTGLEICFMMVPVIIGAVIAGPVAGAVLGGMFGLSSFLTCLGIGHPSAFGAAVLTISAPKAFVMCFVPRLVMGLLVGLIFLGLSRVCENKTLNVLLAGLCGALLNTALFMTALVVLFGSTEYVQNMAASLGASDSVFKLVVAMVGVNGLVESAACVLINLAISRALLFMLPGRTKGET